MKTPVLFIVFNRPDLTKRVFEAIKLAKPPRLYIAADGPRIRNQQDEHKCNFVKQIVDDVAWECEVFKRYSEKNQGCGKGVTNAISWFFEHEEKGIILEDDCLPDLSFFRFCEELLEKYRFDTRISEISGPNTQFGNHRKTYSYYFSRIGHCWGWATWRRVWLGFDLEMNLWPDIKENKYLEDIFEDTNVLKYWYSCFDQHYEKSNTWDFQYAFYCFINNYLSIMPVSNLISNIGHGSDAEHTKESSPYASMKLEPMVFPIAHPPFVIRDKKADEFRENSLFSFRPPKKNIRYFLKRLKRAIYQ